MATSKCSRIYTKKVGPGADCCAAEFCGGGGHPCQGLVPPRATWPSSRSGPADTVRPEFAANTALMYGGRPAGGNGQGAGYCSTGGACRRQGTHLRSSGNLLLQRRDPTPPTPLSGSEGPGLSCWQSASREKSGLVRVVGWYAAGGGGSR